MALKRDSGMGKNDMTISLQYIYESGLKFEGPGLVEDLVL
jgi:hypothetical protein